MSNHFPSSMLDDKDFEVYLELTRGKEPDLVIAPDGIPYIYRWHLSGNHKLMKPLGQNFFHVQVKDDPERPLHDHPWDNTSVILSGGYDETWNPTPWLFDGEADIERHATVRELRKGRMLFRTAGEAHRLKLPKEFPYTMTLFSVGPTVRDWGFWTKDGWVSADNMTEVRNGISVQKEIEK
jgi:hypothetical protein